MAYEMKKITVESASVRGVTLSEDNTRLIITTYREKRGGGVEEMEIEVVVNIWDLLCVRDTMRKLALETIEKRKSQTESLEKWLAKPHQG